MEPANAATKMRNGKSAINAERATWLAIAHPSSALKWPTASEKHGPRRADKRIFEDVHKQPWAPIRAGQYVIRRDRLEPGTGCGDRYRGGRPAIMPPSANSVCPVM